jgi:hypothetical protein
VTPAEEAATHLALAIVRYVDAACTPGQLREALDALDALKGIAEATGWMHPKKRPK